ncbi:MAG: T9SS type A sorting domain-containing protein [Bacteroidetes bacterium]|nr:T9SS type A sorting domain-containing protein [Bacteroidota bacterium]
MQKRFGQNAIITVKDLFGKEVLVNNVENINEFLIQEINISGISSGVYLISASDGQKIYFNKFIKE